MREKALVNMIKTDPHSPGNYRTIGPLVNLDAFYEIFDVKAGDKLYKKPEERIVIW
jgi:putative endopeptidase